MSSYMIVRHKVRDFDEWKQAYDDHQSHRQEAGLTEQYLLRGADDGNEVVAMFAAESIDRAKEFAGSEELKTVMQNAGVIDRPDIHFLNG